MQLLENLQRRGTGVFNAVFRPASVQQRNIRNAMIDGVGVGLVNGVATFLAIFLVRLNASSFLVGLLTSLPALAGMLLALPIGRLLERQRNIVPWYSGSRVLIFAAYAIMGIAPFFVPQEALPITIILIWAVSTVPQIILNVAFTVVMGAIAGPDRRYYLMSRRWSLLGASTAISVAVCGWLLDRFAFPLNYQIVFIGSFFAGLLSFAFSSRIELTNTEQAEEPQAQGWRDRVAEGVTALRENRLYSQFVLSQFVFRFGMGVGLPLFPIFWVRELHAPDTWIGIINTVSSAVLLIAYFIWAGLTRRRGAGIVLRICVFGIACYPLITSLTTSILPLPVYAGFAGLFNAGIDLVLFDILLGTAPKRRTPSYVALYQLTTYVATFFGPLVGTTLGDAIGYTPALITASLIRFAGLGLFVAFNVGAQTSQGSTA